VFKGLICTPSLASFRLQPSSPTDIDISIIVLSSNIELGASHEVTCSGGERCCWAQHRLGLQEAGGSLPSANLDYKIGGNCRR